MPKFFMTMKIPQSQLDRVLTSSISDAAPVTMTRAEALKAYNAGELPGPVSFIADVWSNGKNKNYTRLNEDELPEFAATFVGQPFLKDHAREQDARGGTIRKSELVGGEGGGKFIRQQIEVVKEWAKAGYLDGTIDRFSIGWDAEEYLCTVCGKDFFDDETKHTPWDLGKKDKDSGKTVEVLMKGLEGAETSTVTHPAIGDTGIREQLAQMCELKKGKGGDGIQATEGIELVNRSGKPPEQNREEGMLKQLVSLLGLSSDATEEQALEAIKTRLADPPTVPEAMLKALGLNPSASTDEAILAVVKMSAPGAVVPKAQFDALVVRVNRAEAAAAIQRGEQEGKITPGNRAWFEKLAGENPDMFRSYIAEAPVQIPGQKPYTAEIRDNKPVTDDSAELTPEDLIVLRASSYTKEEFLAAKRLERGGESAMAAKLRAARTEVN